MHLSSLAQPEKGLIVNVGPLVGGTATNVVPDYAACWGNVRFADSEGARALELALNELGRGPAPPKRATPESSDALPRIEVHRAFNRPAKPLIASVQTLAETARATAEDLNQRLPFGSTGGVCDGNILQDAGLPTIDTLGVRGGNLHRNDEFIEIASLVERAQLFAVLLARLGTTSGSA
jgi:glutamate carboxypeptidase